MTFWLECRSSRPRSPPLFVFDLLLVAVTVWSGHRPSLLPTSLICWQGLRKPGHVWLGTNHLIHHSSVKSGRALSQTGITSPRLLAFPIVPQAPLPDTGLHCRFAVWPHPSGPLSEMRPLALARPLEERVELNALLARSPSGTGASVHRLEGP